MKKITLISAIFTLLFITACTKPEENIVNKQSNSSTVPNEQKQAEVPLPAGHDIVNLFFNLINEKRIPEAIAMMSQNAVPDESVKQAWGVQFNAIKSINIQAIEPANQTNWTENSKEYKVTLEAYVTNDPSAPIPYYGWEDNPNIRWIKLNKDLQNQWKVNGISTGP